MTRLATPARPRWSSPRRSDRPTWGPRVGQIAKGIGKPLMPWQQHVADIAGEVDPATGRLVYREVRLTVPRQSGKSTLVLAQAVHRMVDAQAYGGRQKLVYTAQTRMKAREKFVDDYLEELRACPRLRGRWKQRLSNGSESIRWANGSIFGIEATTEKSGHGSTLDGGFIDEAFAHPDDRLEQAFKPAMITRPSPQLWVLSTAGTHASLYLRGKVDSGRQLAEAGVDHGVAYFEWSADDDADPGDPATWRSCMPALGLTVSEDAIAADYLSMKRPEFLRAYLNRWDGDQADEVEWVLPRVNWLRCADAGSQREGLAALAVDVSPSRSRASVVMAANRADGLPMVRVARHGEGVSWLPGHVGDIVAEKGATVVVLDGVGPVSSLEDQIRDAVAGRCPVHVLKAAEVADGCGDILDAVVTEQLRHCDQEMLTSAVEAAAQRPLPGGRFAWDRRKSTGDITALNAATEALWGLTNYPPGGGIVF